MRTASGLERALCAEVAAEVRFDAGSRGAYATDGFDEMTERPGRGSR
ncbi:hypothetical protein V2J94_16395 [Streptomyces sp. DSM 41524]|uniref:Uncharacterized protein n=1 Tax=Streptomyces asiaticus subsp. ignotus TaxID=3098222 RepID=A0ABU7PWH4_9ACTN|nr:hypothetical protein [Streptomyces sp. DSM 41524]